MSPGTSYYKLARGKHIDQVLSEELELGIEQLVILGAGFDTRAYRFEDRLSAVGVFELNQPVTAARKQARVRRVVGVLPHHVTYVCSDLEREGRATGAARATRTRTRLGGRTGRARAPLLDPQRRAQRVGDGHGFRRFGELIYIYLALPGIP
ncbi:MAG: class I SAM-dependent methyltransferase [Solirubrobacteraceae bacterium]